MLIMRRVDKSISQVKTLLSLLIIVSCRFTNYFSYNPLFWLRVAPRFGFHTIASRSLTLRLENGVETETRRQVGM